MGNKQKIDTILDKALSLSPLSKSEAIFIYKNTPLSKLMNIANKIRNKHTDPKYVGWIIDRNINITNGCFSQCLFCNFCTKPNSENQYITSIKEYKDKIDELHAIGGNQLLLQGGMHPKLGLNFYKDLFSNLKKLYPTLKLHALGPAEIHFITSREGITYKETLVELIDSGLDSLPGAGAEILSDRVRNIISPNKCNTQQWLGVMREAHKLNMTTSATMMFGHIETIEERIEHLILLRDLQSEKPKESKGFATFIPWPLMSENTKLIKKFPQIKKVLSSEYIRMITISRIVLNNINNIQASWLTVGENTAKVCLHSGANDLGSIMIEEHVVSSAGGGYNIDKASIKNAAIEAGFIPKLRNQAYEFIE